MDKIVFIATYPTLANIKDGMMQRIKAVDIEFEHRDRLYLSIGRRVNFWPRKERIDERLTVLRINLFLHFWLLAWHLCRGKNFYIHSLYNFCLVRCLSSFRGKNVCIDVHGSVPEELDFHGQKALSAKMEGRERKFFAVASTVVFVSQQMEQYYRQKYPFLADRRLVVKPIFSTNVLREVSQEEQEALRLELGIASQATVLLYSGNLQKWQNFAPMVDLWAKNLHPNYHLVVLTGEPEAAGRILAVSGIPSAQLTVRSVTPNQLAAYYALAHYGMILRDAHVLNKVAAPTKLIEYLYYGLTPVVRYAKIGDAALLGYGYCTEAQFATEVLPAQKNEPNAAIARKILAQNQQNSLSHVFDR